MWLSSPLRLSFDDRRFWRAERSFSDFSHSSLCFSLVGQRSSPAHSLSAHFVRTFDDGPAQVRAGRALCVLAQSRHTTFVGQSIWVRQVLLLRCPGCISSGPVHNKVLGLSSASVELDGRPRSSKRSLAAPSLWSACADVGAKAFAVLYGAYNGCYASMHPTRDRPSIAAAHPVPSKSGLQSHATVCRHNRRITALD